MLVEASAERLNERGFGMMTLEILLTLVELVLLLILEAEPPETFEPPRKGSIVIVFIRFARFSSLIHSMAFFVSRQHLGVHLWRYRMCHISRSLIVVWAYDTTHRRICGPSPRECNSPIGAPHSTFQPV
jgi:hypothetical protein